jgi:tetratricopeptide (TPR) repeat protein
MWYNLASIDLNQGKYNDTCSRFKKALEIAQEKCNKAGEAATFHNLATIDVRQGNNESAIESLRKSWESDKRSVTGGEAATFHLLGFLAKEQGQVQEGLRLVALRYIIDTLITYGDIQNDAKALFEIASKLNYTKEQWMPWW